MASHTHPSSWPHPAWSSYPQRPPEPNQTGRGPRPALLFPVAMCPVPSPQPPLRLQAAGLRHRGRLGAPLRGRGPRAAGATHWAPESAVGGVGARSPTCRQVCPQSAVTYISSLYSTSCEPRLPGHRETGVALGVHRSPHCHPAGSQGIPAVQGVCVLVLDSVTRAARQCIPAILSHSGPVVASGLGSLPAVTREGPNR